MNVAFAFHPGDYANAVRWMQWAEELGPCHAHTLWLMPAKDMLDYEPLRDIAERVFKAVHIMPDAEGINGWPKAANSLVRQAAWNFYLHKLGPWMWLENDCIPLRSGWLDAIAGAYVEGGKPFMGGFVPAQGKIEPRMTGNAVYPENTVEICEKMMVPFLSAPFDQFAAAEILPRAHVTPLFQTRYNIDGKPPTFPDAKSLDILDPQAVLFHRCKDGSLIDRLHERKMGFVEVSQTSGGEAVSRQSHKLEIAGSTPAPATTSAADHIAALKAFCTSPIAKARITKQLRAAGLMPRKAA